MTSEFASQPVKVVGEYGGIMVLSDETISTPNGRCNLREAEFSFSVLPHTYSVTEWNPLMVAISIIVALFTCGLGLLLLFLAHHQKTMTSMVEQITVSGPNLYYVTPGGNGGQPFLSWLKTQQASLPKTQS